MTFIGGFYIVDDLLPGPCWHWLARVSAGAGPKGCESDVRMVCGCESVGGTTSECVVYSTVPVAACDGVSHASGHAGMILHIPNAG